jgi:hypothetical protein
MYKQFTTKALHIKFHLQSKSSVYVDIFYKAALNIALSFLRVVTLVGKLLNILMPE